MTIVHKYFHPDVIELQRELTYHPELLDIINEQVDKDPEIQLCLRYAAIGKYLDVILHDTYTEQDLERLAKIFHMKLKPMRKVNPVGSSE